MNILFLMVLTRRGFSTVLKINHDFHFVTYAAFISKVFLAYASILIKYNSNRNYIGFYMKKIKEIMVLMTLFMSFFITKFGYATMLPDIPEPLKNGTGAVDENGVVYVGMGSAGTTWYKIDLKRKDKYWVRIKPFPSSPREQSISAFLNGELYVFGGIGKKESESTLQVFSDIYKYTPKNNTWQKVNSISPIGLAGHTGIKLSENKILITGGVNKNIFEKYFVDLKEADSDKARKNKVIEKYFNKPAKDYFFNKTMFVYDVKENQWDNAGELPGAGTAGSSFVAINNKVMLINGELKPGLRTDIVYNATLTDGKLSWLKNSYLPPQPEHKIQEGLAGAFSGYSNGVVLVAGGANFPGAKNNYRDGKYYSHEGINKQWQDGVYGLVNGHWQYLGKMKQPLGYGVSVSYDDDIFFLGGENSKGEPVSSVMSVSIHSGALQWKSIKP